MAKYKRQKVKRYRRSFYSRGMRVSGIGIVVLVPVVLGAAWLAAPHVLDWATHTWYTVVRDRDLEAEICIPRGGILPRQLLLQLRRKRLSPADRSRRGLGRQDRLRRRGRSGHGGPYG